MSRFSSFFVTSVALACMGVAAPAAMAQPDVTANVHTQTAPAKMLATRMLSPSVQSHNPACFTEDMDPGDDASMLTVCAAGSAAVASFAP
jgi:hypothetical protein